jgi:hypothetical protein
MKKFAALLMLLTLSMFSLGCTPAEEDALDGGADTAVDADGELDGAPADADTAADADADTADGAG